MEKWQFYDYKDGEKQRNSASAKSFQDQKLVRSIVREFAQNSLDAKENEDRPPVVRATIKKISYTKIEKYIKELIPHLKACGMDISILKGDIEFLILEDFNTTGLEGENFKNFFERDNITNKDNDSKLGGSHGQGKIMFYEASKIKTFFAFSIFSDNNQLKEVLQGTCDLRTHKIKEVTYKEDGTLKLEKEDIQWFKENLFTNRENKKGLSLAIPLTEENNIQNIKNSLLEEFYYPIANKKLEIVVDKETINNDNILDYIDKPKVKLLME